MNEPKPLKAGDACPSCGGELRVDLAQSPERLIESKKRNAASPAAALRFAERVEEKAAAEGVIHKCSGCDYRARLHPKKSKAA